MSAESLFALASACTAHKPALAWLDGFKAGVEAMEQTDTLDAFSRANHVERLEGYQQSAVAKAVMDSPSYAPSRLAALFTQIAGLLETLPETPEAVELLGQIRPLIADDEHWPAAAKAAKRIHALGRNRGVGLALVGEMAASLPGWGSFYLSAPTRSLPDDIRDAGWHVAVHNDYVLDDVRMTFWLFTSPALGRFVKGEGASDEEALNQVRAEIDGLTKTQEESAMSSRSANDLVMCGPCVDNLCSGGQVLLAGVNKAGRPTCAHLMVAPHESPISAPIAKAEASPAKNKVPGDERPVRQKIPDEITNLFEVLSRKAMRAASYDRCEWLTFGIWLQEGIVYDRAYIDNLSAIGEQLRDFPSIDLPKTTP